ncbi:MAG TPA: DMT family transporter [Candidatus Poseidoniales archaeon]|nr:DMT family transporter [Candidatus Poseidoniales archaeon]
MNRRQATLALFSVTIIWGWTFIWLKRAMIVADAHGAGVLGATLFVTLRFALGGALLPLFPGVRNATRGRAVWRDGALLALFIFSGFLFQMLAIAQLTPDVSAFLTSLYVVFTALLLAGWRGRLQSTPLLCGAALATFGAGWIQGPPQLHFNWPEWLTVFSALLFAGHIIATDVVTRRVSPLGVTFSSITLAALMGLLLLNLQMLAQPAALGELLRDPAFLEPLLLSAFFGTLVALLLVNRCQKLLDPVRAAILYALEPVWATLLAITYGMVTANGWLLLGGGALLLGNLVAELAPRRKSG